MTARNEYPRPQFVREHWMNLNGAWEFEFDDRDAGLRERWYERTTPLGRTIQVPFCYQSELSGIGDTGFHDIVWYRRSFALTEAFAGKRTLLHFGAVDYAARVWVNGRLAATHEGGHSPFSADITDLLEPGDNTVVVRAQDFSRDLTLPRGKQYWKERSASIFYTRTTGIWQTVWLEPVSRHYLERIRVTPDLDRREVCIQSFLNGTAAAETDVRLTTTITFQGEFVAEDTVVLRTGMSSRTYALKDDLQGGDAHVWRPEQPHLYDIACVLAVDGAEADRVSSYFGLRKISIDNGKLCLNNSPYRMKLVLDQGYFPQGILTAPTDDDLRRDVELTLAMGFNGVRKHQKLEDPRYLYWCDKLGLLVWGEMANAYAYSETYAARFQREWGEAVERDYNHPSLVVWVPINESWGVPEVDRDAAQQAHALAMYAMTKSLDQTRPVVSNDGWEHVRSDLCTIHDYESRESVLRERYGTVESAVAARPAGRKIYAGEQAYRGEPILVTEFGGISFRKSEWEGWGYSSATDEVDFLERLRAVTSPLLESPVVAGYCYTQLTDVEQEINGLLTYDRRPKVPLEWIRLINQGKPLPPEATARPASEGNRT